MLQDFFGGMIKRSNDKKIKSNSNKNKNNKFVTMEEYSAYGTITSRETLWIFYLQSGPTYAENLTIILGQACEIS